MEKISIQKIKQIQKVFECNRIKLLTLLLEKETCVCEMVTKTDLKHNLISHHLKTLVDIGFITNRRNGQHVMYNLLESKKPMVVKIMDMIN